MARNTANLRGAGAFGCDAEILLEHSRSIEAGEDVLQPQSIEDGVGDNRQ